LEKVGNDSNSHVSSGLKIFMEQVVSSRGGCGVVKQRFRNFFPFVVTCLRNWCMYEANRKRNKMYHCSNLCIILVIYTVKYEFSARSVVLIAALLEIYFIWVVTLC
jgi:hypothetical protein